jgi:hypothetical protein
MPLRPPQIPHNLCSKPGHHGGKPATNRLSYGTTNLHDIRKMPDKNPFLAVSDEFAVSRRKYQNFTKEHIQHNLTLATGNNYVG